MKSFNTEQILFFTSLENKKWATRAKTLILSYSIFVDVLFLLTKVLLVFVQLTWQLLNAS